MSRNIHHGMPGLHENSPKHGMNSTLKLLGKMHTERAKDQRHGIMLSDMFCWHTRTPEHQNTLHITPVLNALSEN